MATVGVLSSAEPLLAMLDDPDEDTQAYALQLLHDDVQHYWSEIADSIAKLYVDVFLFRLSSPLSNNMGYTFPFPNPVIALLTKLLPLNEQIYHSTSWR